MPRVKSHDDAVDPVGYGRNVRQMRTARGWSIVALAKRAGVAPHTVFRIENGLSSTDTTRTKIAFALDTVVERLAAKGGLARSDVSVHTHADSEWIALLDNRPRLPEDNSIQIQIDEERERLGRLKFVPQFVKVLRCRLPKGKLTSGVLELYGDLPPSTYLGGEIFAYTLRGDASLVMDGEVLPMPLGTAVTFDCTKPFFFRNENPDPPNLPPLVLYVRLDEVEPLESRKPKRGRTVEGRYQVWAVEGRDQRGG
jgi:transcriptional regulator with XRE-family HTH domain